MNKVFKTVWNASLGVWVAVSETASSQKKGSNKLKKAAANAVATVAIGAATIGGVHAGWNNGNGTASTDSIAIGSPEGKADASAEQATAVGTGAKAGGGSVSLGYQADSTGQEALALGAKSKATVSSTIAIGANSQATAVNSLSIGTSSSATGKDSTTIGAYAVANKEGATSIGQAAQATGIEAIAIGKTAIASGKNAIAIGTGTKAEFEDSIAIGSKAVVSKKGSIVIGTGTASGENSTVIGGGEASGADAQVFGGGAASGEKAKVFGGGTASGIGAQVFGIGEAAGDYAHVFGSGKATAENALVLGAGEASAMNSMALGTSTVLAEDSVAIGGSNTINLGATKSFILGSNVVLNNANSVVLGDNSVLRNIHYKAAVDNPVITKLDEDGNVILNSEKDRSYTMSFAGTTTDGASGAVSVGSSGKERQIQYVGAGRITEKSTDAVNGSQLYAILTEVAKLEETPINFDDGKGGQATVKLGDTFNIEGAQVAMKNGKPTLTVTAGSWNLATGGDVTNASTIGGDTNVVNFVGSKNSEVSQTVLTDATGKPIGTQVNVEVADQINLTGDAGSLTIGAGAGKQPIVIQQGNVNLGGNKLENIAAGTALTDAVNVSQLQSSGWNIITQDKDAAGNVTGTTENAVNGDKEANTSSVQFNGDKNISVSQSKDEQTGQPVITVELEKDIDLSEEGSLTIGNTFLNDAGLTLAGATVGSKTYAPIIINQGNVNFGGNVLAGVAPGVAGTDAVNVDQLTGTTDSVVNIIGGGVTNGPNNTVTGPFEVNGTQYPDIAEAIKNETAAAKTEVTAGKNITVTPTVDPQTGKTTYEVKTNDEVDFEKVTVGDVVISAESDDITGLSNTKIGDDAEPDFATVGRAATEEQLDKAITGLGDILGGGLINNNGQITGPFVVNGTGYDTVADAIKNEAEVAAEAAKIKVTEGKNITVTASTDPDTGKITGYEVKTNDEVDFEKVTVGDVVISAESNDITGLSNTTIGNQAAPDFAQAGRGATEEQLDGTAGSVANILGGNVTNNNGSVTGPFVVNENEYNTVADAIEGESAAAKTEVQAGKNITVNTTVGANGQNIYTVATADKASFTEVKFGDKVTINENGINAGDTQIINVAAGTENHHAVNLGQMNTAITNLEQSFNTRIDDVEDRMSAGIASAMALETAPYVPGKYTYAAATAYHNGQAALGITLRKTADNGRWSLTGGVATGTEGDPSVRLGVSGIID